MKRCLVVAAAFPWGFADADVVHPVGNGRHLQAGTQTNSTVNNAEGTDFEGDIVPLCEQIKDRYPRSLLEKLVALKKIDGSCLEDDGERKLGLIPGSNYLWDNRRNDDGVVEVPYSFHSSFEGSSSDVVDSINELALQSGVVKFVPRTNEKPYLSIVDQGGCWSYVGQVFIEDQKLSLSPGCVYNGSIHHEFLHALGMWHEQSRPDRDDHVTINTDNIRDGYEINFQKMEIADSRGSAYDYNSVLHYRSSAFSKNGQDTIDSHGHPIGQRDAASASDILQLRLLYQCSTGPRTLDEYNENTCTTNCKCWEGEIGCGTNDDACQGDLECISNQCTTPSADASDGLQEGSESGNSGGSYGDPHLQTWTGEIYDFHGECDLILTKSAKFGMGIGFEIQIRTEIRFDWSFISAVAVKIGDDVLEVQSKAAYYLNGVQSAELPGALSDFPVTTKDHGEKRHMFEVSLRHMGTVVIKVYGDFLAVTVKNAHANNFGDSVGLMGSFEGKLIGRDRYTEFHDTNLYGLEWQVQDSETMLFKDIKGPQFPAMCNMPSHQLSRRRLAEAGMISMADAERACRFWPIAARESCIYDTLSTGDLGMAEAGAF